MSLLNVIVYSAGKICTKAHNEPCECAQIRPVHGVSGNLKGCRDAILGRRKSSTDSSKRCAGARNVG